MEAGGKIKRDADSGQKLKRLWIDHTSGGGERYLQKVEEWLFIYHRLRQRVGEDHRGKDQDRLRSRAFSKVVRETVLTIENRQLGPEWISGGYFIVRSEEGVGIGDVSFRRAVRSDKVAIGKGSHPLTSMFDYYWLSAVINITLILIFIWSGLILMKDFFFWWYVRWVLMPILAEGRFF